MHWFDIREGKMIVGDAAYESVIEQSGPGDIVPLAELISTDMFDTADWESYDKQPWQRYSEEDARLYGSWVLNLVQEFDTSAVIEARHLDRLSRLRIGMSLNTMRRHAGTAIGLNSELGVPNYSEYGAFDDWSEQDFTNYTAWLADTIGRRPRKADFDEHARMGHGPSQNIISVKSGQTIGYFNERIGYPNIRNMTPEDYLKWGALLAEANPHLEITQDLVEIVSRRDRGPSAKILHPKFGGVMNFRSAVKQWQEDHPKQELVSPPHYEQLYPLLEDYLGERAPTESSAMLELAAKMELASALLVGLRNAELLELVIDVPADDMIEMLINENYNLTEETIRKTADKLGSSLFIWPPDSAIKQHLYVSHEELAAYRKNATAVKMRWKRERRKRMLASSVLNSEPAPNQAIEQ